MAFTFLRTIIKDGGVITPAMKKAQAEAAKNAAQAAAKAKPAPAFDLNQPGRLRAAQVRQILGVSQSTFYAGVKSGRFPSASGKDGAMVYWDTAVIRDFLAGKP